ncbi:MAG: class I SAM-dependent methyltransferase [Hellea sp.]|nr:class I SAM-dependent methyltransferase [Hellea sp.]
MRLLKGLLTKFVGDGRMTVIDADGNRHEIGKGLKDGPHPIFKIHDKKLYTRLFLNPELVAGEAYMDGTITFEEGSTLHDLLKLFKQDSTGVRKHPMQKALKGWLKKIRRFHQRNQTHAARENVQHHYDLSNDFYRLFLDEDMQYSCAYWSDPDMTLEQAQEAKKAHIAAKLNLKPGDKVLDIGCGWGGKAIYIAQNFGCEVVGVTLSDNQHRLARERVKAAGLSDKINIRIQDYRHIEEKFDAVVSVGMFEHVGLAHFREYFEKIRDLLTDDGCALIHSIGRKGGPSTTGAWIRKYIFPGGYSPALSETFAEIEKAKLWVTDCEIWRLHYAETIKEWESRFQANKEKITDMFDERFFRMFEFYLIISEYSFRYGSHMNFQIQLTKDRNALPLTRDYMIEAERKLS